MRSCWNRLKVVMWRASSVHPLSLSPVSGEYSCVPEAAASNGWVAGEKGCW